MDTENYVAKLNEYVQRARSELNYEDIRTDGPDHIKTFSIRVVLNGVAYPEGVGNNKKEAKQKAAKHALEHIMKKNEQASEASLAPVSSTAKNYVSWLYEYGAKIKMPVKFHESTKPGSYKPFQCRFSIGEIEYPVANGTSKKEAKEEAARLAYHDIYEASQTEDEELFGASSEQKEENCDKSPSSKTEDDSFVETNFIGNINHYCQRTHRTHNFIEVGRSGPSHNHKFSYKLVIDGKDYPVGAGKTIKEAKQNAAQLALSALEKEDSKVLESFTRPKSASMDFPPNLESSGEKNMMMTPQSISVEFVKSSPKVQRKSTGKKVIRKIAANFGPQDVNSIDFKDSEPNSRFEKDFDCIEYIKKGAFGMVFKAKHKLEEKNYAVKVVQYKEKSLREILALSEFHHKNIVRYHTCWTEDGAYKSDSPLPQSATNPSGQYLYIQMELCDTTTLRDWIDDMNTQNVEPSQRRESCFDIVQQIVEGVEYIHAKTLIHRDLKPANILFGLDNTVKIGDFGLVTYDNDGMDRSLHTGTPNYMAPEQKDKIAYDRKVDIFALGLIYFELLWSMITYSEKAKIWIDIGNQKLPAEFSSLFPMEQKIIKSMLSWKPEDRPEASQLKTDLGEFANELQFAKHRKTV
ncbi:interferon-induced, double-stranded RNA-activated protein kinase isoform X2 [Corythoichthys intestinalis]|uniref:interferon-induced, double-stranded RNA-activated protein kinase isoform X2 n=1 Tax=Corythoichthys intestinalis TaxID=161448 RepID=UPI0025A61140|nr:interferon-induced, double-stranded RNA-activated protein kinase isoform X2 [Corythoichthys intestinalis]